MTIDSSDMDTAAARLPGDRARPAAVAGACIALFALLAIVVGGDAHAWDRSLFEELYVGASPFTPGAEPNQSDLLRDAVPIFNRLSDDRLIVILAAGLLGLLLALRRRRAATFFAASVSIALLAPALKQLFDRRSPFPIPGDPSFPSGHAMTSMAIVAAALVLVGPTWRRWAAIPAAGFATAVAISVIADGGHWPTDVLGGWLLAIAWVCVVAVALPERRPSSAPRSAAQELVSAAIRWSGVGFLVRRTISRRRASILLYHDPAREVFERHLRYLARRYAFVSLSELVDAIREGRWTSLPPNPLVITFDDAHRRNAQLAGIMRRCGVRPTIYACSQILDTERHFWFLEAPDPEPLKPLPTRERLARLQQSTGFTPTREYRGERQAMAADEVAGMLDTIEIASHTRFHPVLTTCEDAECADEIGRSKAEITELTGVPCRHFSFPNGDYGAREVEEVRRAGYSSARTTDLGWNDAATDVYRLRILGTGDDASVNRLAADLSGITGYIARLRQGSLSGRHVQVSGR